MAAAVPAMMVAQTAMGTLGALKEGSAAYAQGKLDRSAAYEEGNQHLQNSTEALGDANRKAYDIRRQGKIMESDAVAAMVAGGGSASDAGAIEHLSKVHQANEYDALSAVFEGDKRAADHRKAARSAFYSGDVAYQAGKDAKKASYMNALTTAVGGAMKVKGYYDDRAAPKTT
jgi:hypothetical protein